jgi:hypothetical protein
MLKQNTKEREPRGGGGEAGWVLGQVQVPYSVSPTSGPDAALCLLSGGLHARGLGTALPAARLSVRMSLQTQHSSRDVGLRQQVCIGPGFAGRDKNGRDFLAMVPQFPVVLTTAICGVTVMG